MIAKVISHGASRDIALAKLSAALGETEIVGLTTNLEFLGKLVRHSDFATGNMDTGLIDRAVSTLCKADDPSLAAVALATIAASGIDETGSWWSGFSIWRPLEQAVTLLWRGREFPTILKMDGSSKAIIHVENQKFTAHCEGGVWLISDVVTKMHALKSGPIVSVFGNTTWHFVIPDPLAVGDTMQSAGNIIAAPMPGVVRDVIVKAGQDVAAGDPLIVLEAMKMEHILTSPRAGQIEDVGTDVGQQVANGATLIKLADPEEDQSSG